MKDDFNRKPIKVNNLIIDNEEFELCDEGSFEERMQALRSLSAEFGGWVNEGSVVYVRFPYHNPPSKFFQLLYGVLIGFTDGKPLLMDGIMYRSGLLTAPVVTHSADAFTYDLMKFNTATISIENTGGRFDDPKFTGRLFGNECNLLVGTLDDEKDLPQQVVQLIEEGVEEKIVSMDTDTDEYITLIGPEKEKESLYKRFTKIAQYYIESVTVSLGKATFRLKDKRERLTGKIPNRQFVKDENGWLDEKYYDTDMQEVYGRCLGVPGVCVESERMFENESDIDTEKLNRFRFRFSSQISHVDRIWVKMTAGELPEAAGDHLGPKRAVDGWTLVYDGGWLIKDHPDYGAPGDLETYKNDGIITLRWDIVRQGGFERDSSMNEVRMDGVFISFDRFPDDFHVEALRGIPRATPRGILRHIMEQYSCEPSGNRRYHWAEIDAELGKLDDFEIGIMFDKAVTIFQAIEKLQSGSVKGFQYLVHKDKYTARLDDPDREPEPKESRPSRISHLEILNLNEIEVDWNAGLYGSYTDIEYAYNYGEKKGLHLIDREKRTVVLRLHRWDKEWKIKTLLANIEDVQFKSDMLLDDFSEPRPLIKNIKLEGEKWHGLRVYDTMFIDFSIPGEERDKYPQHIIRLIEEVGEEKVISIDADTDEYVALINDEKENRGGRLFAGELRCQVMRVELDVRTGITTIDVRAYGKA